LFEEYPHIRAKSLNLKKIKKNEYFQHYTKHIILGQNYSNNIIMEINHIINLKKFKKNKIAILK